MDVTLNKTQAMHLPGEHNILFDPAAPDDVIENKHLNKPSRLMAYFTLNRNDPDARRFKYVEIPEHYTWDDKIGQWNPRRKTSKMFGNLWEVSPRNVQLFHMHILLQHVRGAQSFEDLRTVRGELYPDFVVACERLNLLDNAQCYQAALREAALRDAPKRFRRFFAVLCLTAAERLGNSMVDLWIEFKDPHCISDLIRLGYTRSVALRLALHRIKSVMQALRDDVDLAVFAFFHDPEASTLEEAEAAIPEPINQFMRGIDDEHDEQQLNRQRNETFTVASLTDHQRSIHNEVIFCILATTGRLDDRQLMTTLDFDLDYVNSRSGSIDAANLNLLFLDGPGGTGKTFLYNVILWQYRKANLSTIAVAFTGIAASLLMGGKTSHRGFKMPISFDKTTKVGWPAEHDMSNELRTAHLVIWDEASMVSSNIVAAVDRYFRDLMGKYDKAFGGKLFLFGEDFRQTLPIIIRGHQHEIVANCPKRSDLWPCMRKVSLQDNLRVRRAASEFANARNLDERLVQIYFQKFAQFIRDMGEGKTKNFCTRTVGVWFGQNKTGSFKLAVSDR